MKSGIPKRNNPPGSDALSKTVVAWPARLINCAAAKPEGPDPITATALPVLSIGLIGLIQPSFQPLSAIAFSICSMATASEFIFKTQDASQGAGQILPVNSGKLLVACKIFNAFSHSPK